MRLVLTAMAVALCTIQGCATITPEAEKVMVHSQVSNLLDGCEKLGNVSASVSGWSKGTWDDVYQQAKNDLRDKAYKQYGADTVAVINSDKQGSLVTMQGIAFKCNK